MQFVKSDFFFYNIRVMDFYGIKVKDLNLNDVSLSVYRGKLLLIVNTAIKCGYTKSYSRLEELYRKYRDRGFEILDFPCNQFAAQAPGTNREINDYVLLHYRTEFPRFAKIDVNGKNESPLYTFLKKELPFRGFDFLKDPSGEVLASLALEQDPKALESDDIKWNFTKFLVSREGKGIRRFEPGDSLDEVEKEVVRNL